MDCITWDRTLKLLQIDIYELKDLVKSGELPIYSGRGPDEYKIIRTDDKMFYQVENLLSSNMDWIKEDCRFLRQDVERLIENPRADSLSGEERRELGRLRREKEKLDFNIKAAVHSGLFCQRMGRPVSKVEIKDEILNNAGDEPTELIFRKIWKSLPAGFKKSAGRPKK